MQGLSHHARGLHIPGLDPPHATSTDRDTGSPGPAHNVPIRPPSGCPNGIAATLPTEILDLNRVKRYRVWGGRMGTNGSGYPFSMQGSGSAVPGRSGIFSRQQLPVQGCLAPPCTTGNPWQMYLPDPPYLHKPTTRILSDPRIHFIRELKRRPGIRPRHRKASAPAADECRMRLRGATG